MLQATSGRPLTLLLKLKELHAIKDGGVDLVFRRWKRPTVRSGRTLRTAIGMLSIEAADHVDESSVSDAEARRAGFDSRGQLMAELGRWKEGDLYRVALRFAGADPRIELRERSNLSEGEIAEIDRRLGRLDAGRRGPWTSTTLRLIAESPETRAADLAVAAGVDRIWFKANVRKLKNLGLTESLGTGYRLSPRGRAYLQLRPETG